MIRPLSSHRLRSRALSAARPAPPSRTVLLPPRMPPSARPPAGFVVKHAIGAAMNFLPSRQAFFQGLAGPAAQPGASQPQAAPPQVMAPQPSGGTGMPMEMGGGSGMGGGMQMLQTTSAMTPSDVEAKLGVFLASVEPLRAELWRFYGQLGLTNLP